MSDAITLPVRAEPSRLFRGLGAFVASIAEGLRAHRRCQELWTLSDAQLNARGISREDIPHVAMFGAPRR